MKVKSIRKIGRRKTYDINVPKLNNFFLSNGILSHNSGKTVSMLSLAGMYHDNPTRKYKIFDLWGGDRNEHLYWTLPSNQNKYWNYTKKSLRLNEDGPKQYKVNLLYPIFTKKMIKKFPQNENVKAKIFTIPIQDLTPQDFSLVLGNLSESSIARWRDTLNKSKKKDSASKVLKAYREEGGTNDLLYKSILHPLSRNLFLQDNNCIYNLDVKSEVADQETISVLCLDYVEKEYRLFVMGYLLRKVAEELDRRHRHVIGMVREASEFFRARDQTVVEDRYKVIKLAMSQWIRMGRRGMHLFLDTQSPNETSGIVDGQQDLTFLGRLPGEADRRTATDQMKRDGKVTTKQIKLLADNGPGQFLVCPAGEHAYMKYVLLPRCRYWEENNGNFYKNIWEKEVNQWTSFNKELDRLKEEYEEQEELNKNKPKKMKNKNTDDIYDILDNNPPRYIPNPKPNSDVNIVKIKELVENSASKDKNTFKNNENINNIEDDDIKKEEPKEEISYPMEVDLE